MTIKFLSISTSVSFSTEIFSRFWSSFQNICLLFFKRPKICNNDDDNSSRSRGKEAFDGDQNILRQDRDDKVIGCRRGQVNTNQKRDKLRIPRPKKDGLPKHPFITEIPSLLL